MTLLHGAGDALTAIDAPLEWPAALAASLAGRSAGDVVEPVPRTLFRRVTVDDVYERLHKRPLEVRSNRIARAAWRVLDVLGRLRSGLARSVPALVEP